MHVRWTFAGRPTLADALMPSSAMPRTPTYRGGCALFVLMGSLTTFVLCERAEAASVYLELEADTSTSGAIFEAALREDVDVETRDAADLVASVSISRAEVSVTARDRTGVVVLDRSVSRDGGLEPAIRAVVLLLRQTTMEVPRREALDEGPAAPGPADRIHSMEFGVAATTASTFFASLSGLELGGALGGYFVFRGFVVHLRGWVAGVACCEVESETLSGDPFELGALIDLDGPIWASPAVELRLRAGVGLMYAENVVSIRAGGLRRSLAALCGACDRVVGRLEIRPRRSALRRDLRFVAAGGFVSWERARRSTSADLFRRGRRPEAALFSPWVELGAEFDVFRGSRASRAP